MASQERPIASASPETPASSETTGAIPGAVVRYDQAWLSSFLRPFLIAILAGCLAVAMLAFYQRFAPNLTAAYRQAITLISIGGAVMGCITTSWLAQPGQRMRRSLAYRAGEFTLLMIATRLSVWLLVGNWPAPYDLITRPLSSLLDGWFMAGAFVVALTWVVATEMTRDLIDMALQADEIYAADSRNDYRRDSVRAAYTDRPALLRSFVGRWVIGGIILVLLAAGSRMDMPEQGFFAIVRQNIDPVVIAAVVVYFLVGLVLISQGQLAILRSRWLMERTPNQESVLRNWPLYVILLVGGVGLLAALLPFGGTFRLAQILSAIINVIYIAVYTIFRLIMMGILLLLSLLPFSESPPPPMPAAQPLVNTAPQAPPSDAAAVAGGLFFWLVALLLLGYAAYVYFSDKGRNFSWLVWFWQMLRLRLSELFGGGRRRRTIPVGATEETEAAGQDGPLRRLLRRFRRGPLSPAEQVRLFYLSLLDQAQDVGHPRRRAETPGRYAPRLTRDAALEDEENTAVQELTDAFVHVHYADRSPSPNGISRLEEAWKLLKRRLQRTDIPS